MGIFWGVKVKYKSIRCEISLVYLNVTRHSQVRARRRTCSRSQPYTLVQMAAFEISCCAPSPILSGPSLFSCLLSLSCSILSLINPAFCPSREYWMVILPNSQRLDCSSLSHLTVSSLHSPCIHYQLDRNLTQLELFSFWPPVPSIE